MQLALPSPSSFMSRLFARGAQGTRSRVTRWFAAQVRHGATREIPAAAGQMTLHCRNGEAWITHDGDPKDVMLQANQSYAVQGRGGRMTVHAMKGDCVFEIQVDE